MTEPRRRPLHAIGGARTRILATFVLLLAASTLVSTVLLRQILQGQVADRVQQSLVQEVDEFRTLATEGVDPETSRPFADVQRVFEVYLARNVPNRGEAWFTFVGTSPFRATTAPPGGPEVRERVTRLGTVTRTERSELRAGDSTLTYLAVPVRFAGSRAGAFVVLADLRQEEDEVAQATQVAAGVSLAVLLLASLVAFLLTGRTLAPLRDLTDATRAITDTDLTRRIDVKGSDEIAELGHTFNGMLERLDRAFGVQRAFVSDAGHELRTPITIIRGHLELLGDDPQERADTIALVTDELDRMSRIVEDLLVLARAERPDFLQPGDLDLDLFTEELLAKAQALSPREWTLEGLGTGRLTADRQRLTQAVMNLAVNAVRHTPDGARLALGSALTPTEARIWVSDGGPGIPEADRARIFERFARGTGGRRRSDGAGLGLSIVDAIVRAHGGRVELDTRPGAVATFTIHGPVEPLDPVPEEDLP